MVFDFLKSKTKTIKEDSFWSKLIRNIVSGFVGETGAAVLSVITTIAIIWIIGDYRNGVFVLAQSYMTIIDGLINFQSWQAVIKYGSEYIEQKDNASLASIIKMGMLVDIITAILGMIVAVLILPFVSQLLNWSSELQICALVFSIEILFHFSGASIGVLRLYDKFNYVAVQKIVVAFLKLLAVLGYYLLGGHQLVYLAISYVCASIIGHILLTVLSFYAIQKSGRFTVRALLAADTKGYRKKFWDFALWTNLTSSIDIPVKQLDVFILSSISMEIVSVFKVFKQIGNVLVQLSIPISQAIMPQFSELIAQGKLKECYQVLLKLRKAILMVMIPATVIITIVSPWALKVFFGPLYSKYFYVLALYLLARTFALSYTAIHQLFVSMGRVKENFLFTLYANLAYLLVAFPLTRWIGITGTVIAIFVEFIIVIELKKNAIVRTIKHEGVN